MTGPATPLIDRIGANRASVSLDERILDATLRCIARWGVAKTTLDDIAREAGCSRATVYRVFPGGKDVLFAATWTREVESFAAALLTELHIAPTLEDLLVVALTESCRAIRRHEALQYLVEHEPGAVMPLLSFDALDPFLAWTAAYAAPAIERFVPASASRELAEWCARLIISYGFEPTPALDLTDPDSTRRFVRTYVLPGSGAAATVDLR